jgi:hypothetical protein
LSFDKRNVDPWKQLSDRFQSECRIQLEKHSNENIVLQAIMDEFEENREKGNVTAEILHREKVGFRGFFYLLQKNCLFFLPLNPIPKQMF